MRCLSKPISIIHRPACFLLSFCFGLFLKIAFCAVQNTKGKSTFGNIETMQLCNFVSSVARKRHPLNLNNFRCIQSNSSNICRKIFSFAGLQGMRLCSSFRRRNMVLNFFLCVYIYWKGRFPRDAVSNFILYSRGNRVYGALRLFHSFRVEQVRRKTRPRQANLLLIAEASSEGSGEPAHPRSLARTFAARSYKQCVKRNLQTESQIPGPSEWLGMRN